MGAFVIVDKQKTLRSGKGLRGWYEGSLENYFCEGKGYANRTNADNESWPHRAVVKKIGA
jgi:hypothetical protein